MNERIRNRSVALLLATSTILLLWTWFSGSSSPVAAEESLKRNESIAIGTGTISGGNPALAREAAISQALIRGVEQYLIRKLGSQTIVHGFPRLTRDVLPKGEELVENFQVLAEEQVSGRYNVLVRLRVNEEIVEDTLRSAGLFATETVPVKILFMVAETSGEGLSYWWRNPAADTSLNPTEVALYRVFQERGFSPVNRTFNIPSGDVGGYVREVELEPQQVAAWGRMFSSDIVIYGFSVIQEEDITLSLSVVDARQGDIIGDSTRVASIPNSVSEEDVLESLETLAEQIAAKLTPAIRQAAGRTHGGTTELDVTLKGLTSYSQFRMVQNFLSREVQGVQSVRQTRVRKDSISIAVEFQGNEDMFLNRFLNHERLPLKLSVEQSGEGQIVLTAEDRGLPEGKPDGR